MTWLDYATCAVFLASTAWGAWRGLLREIIAILGWALAFLAAGLFSGPLAERMPAFIQIPQLRVVAAYVLVFVLALLATTVAGIVVARLAQAAGLGGLDRMLGACFGVLRGVLILVVFALLAGLTSLPLQRVWIASYSGPVLAYAVKAVIPWLPQSLTQKISFEGSV
jgi:membrane protein required for colicin V production